MTTGRYPLSWDLESLFPTPNTPTFRTTLDAFSSRIKSLAEDAEKLPAFQASTVTEWENFLQKYETVDAQYTDLSAYIGCQSAGDAENKLYQQLEAELSALGPYRERLATTVEFALKELSNDDFQQAIAASTYLTKISYFLKLKRRQATFRLPREQELLAADLAVDGLHAWGRMYDRLSGALRVTVIEKGKPVQKSPGQVLFDSPQRTVRENNFFAVDAAWATIEDSCADAINHIAGTRLTTYRRLGLKDHLEAPLMYNRMSRATLDSMWSTITAHKPVLKDYLDCKARWLGLEKLTWYDLAAPLPSIPGTVVDDDISYDQACDWIVEAFEQFSPELGSFARMALTEKWVEAENRSGKRQGGFCTSLPTPKVSRIFMTYTNSADSMSTLAHELGHAYHSWVLRDEPVFLADYPMNLAETASTFAEAVLNEQRLQRAKTDYEKLALLDGLLGDAVAFLMNIHARFLFENAFHVERAREELTAKRFGELMEAAQKEAYLGALADGGWNPRFWASKLHFYITSLPFYNFPYTFGYLLSLGVYAVGRDAGPSFPAQYRQLLMATGCQDAEDAVQSTLGFDLRGGEFWTKSLSIITSRVQQFRELTDNVLGKTRQL
ncbi:MAG TPA: M3 family oligoendopeptidase [Planctomycetaceae bacterium]|nr:M3 family oligoendopeptidase [Planctomycetaceae bacterium]